MKVAHFGNFAPNSCGMFHTTVDTVLAERRVGIDSRFIDWGYAKHNSQRYSRVGLSFGGIVTEAPTWGAEQADILVLHSALPDFIKECGKPVVVAIHGRPEYSFMMERLKKGSCLNLYHTFARDPQVIGFYTYWQEHMDYWNLLLEKPVNLVPAMVDLDRFTPKGPSPKFKNSGKPNILVADIWREDTSPFHVVFAAAKFIRDKCPEGRLHIYGLSNPNETTAMGNLLNPLKEKNIVGDVHGLMRNIHEVYRDADMLVTPHNIATRVVRESLASGCPIVAASGCKYTPFQAEPKNTDAFVEAIEDCWEAIQKEELTREGARELALNSFDLKQSGKALKELYVEGLKNAVPVVKAKKKKAKKRDYRIHTFTAYATEVEGENIGIAYNKLMELVPKDEDWACFLDHDAMFTTSDWNRQLYEIIDANPEYSCFTAVTNRIGNTDQRFKAIDVKNHDIVYHREIGKKAQKQYRTVVKDVSDHQLMSGVLMLVQKATWKKIGGFLEQGFLGIDNDFDKRSRAYGLKTGVMKGVYLYHWYRFKDSKLKPIM